MRLLTGQDIYLLALIALFAFIGAIPSRRVQYFLSDLVGSLAYYWSPDKRRRSEERVRQVFSSSRSRAQLRQIVLGGFREFWRDQTTLWSSPPARNSPEPVELEGFEYLQTALKAGQGVILLESSLFGGRNLAKQTLHKQEVRIHQVYGHRHLAGFMVDEITWFQEKLIRPAIERREKKFVAEIIRLPAAESIAYTRRLLALLDENSVICIPADGAVGHKVVPQQFLGETDFFPTGVWSLGRVSGAALLPLFCVRSPSGEPRLIFERPLVFSSTLGREQALEKIMCEYFQLLEFYIRKYPEQYRGWHSAHSPAPSTQMLESEISRLHD